MSHDIVERLREEGFITHMARLPRESKILHEAADEIERLRAGGCARDQKTTQFCAEAVALQREVERLREELRVEKEELAACCIDRRETQRERDEARREVCVWSCRVVRADRWMPTERVALGNEEDVAKSRNWDCFKEESRGDD